ncbi:hypothetical protein P7C70_g8039, partial [Phenoliferia sp. Uapishka_3]
MLPRLVPPLARTRPAYDVIHRFFSNLAKPQISASSFTSRPSVRTRHLYDALRTAATTPTNRRAFGVAGTAGTGRLYIGTRASVQQQYRSYATPRPSQPPKCPDPSCPHEPNLSQSTSLTTPPPPSTRALTKPHPSYLSSLPASLRRLAATLPAKPGRPPSRDQLLALSTSFFERLKIRFKWATIRSYRHYRADDYSAFFSFGILGTLGWFAISTTSFFAFVFLIINSLSLQEWFAQTLGDYLTAHTGVTVIFESAIVPKWGFADGGSKIVFKNVYISRGPNKAELGVLPPPPTEEDDPTEEEIEERERMAKWTHFHLSIDTVEVSLSLGRWLDGLGIVREASITGVRGVVGTYEDVK